MRRRREVFLTVTENIMPANTGSMLNLRMAEVCAASVGRKKWFRKKLGNVERTGTDGGKQTRPTGPEPGRPPGRAPLGNLIIVARSADVAAVLVVNAASDRAAANDLARSAVCFEISAVVLLL